MKLHLKDHTVNLDGLTLPMVWALAYAMKVWQLHGVQQLTVTSANDARHKINSLHYTGNALDLRSRTLPDAQGMTAQLADILGPDYDVILETDHIHIEYHPKT